MVTMFWSYRVADWDEYAAFMKSFESDPVGLAARETVGMISRWVYRSVDDPNEVMNVARFRTREGAEQLLRNVDRLGRWREHTGLDLFPPVLITEAMDELAWRA